MGFSIGGHCPTHGEIDMDDRLAYCEECYETIGKAELATLRAKVAELELDVVYAATRGVAVGLYDDEVLRNVRAGRLDAARASAAAGIETLLDVWNLEDPDRIERALREISIGMVHARLYQRALLAAIHEEHPDLRAHVTDWPGYTDWTDDGRGEISLRHTHEGRQVAEVKITVDHDESEG